MGIDPAAITDKIRRLMDPGGRKSLGKYGETTAEASTRRALRLETRIHRDFIDFLNRHALLYYYDNPTKKRTGPVGEPDFRVGPRAHRCFFVEFKVPPNKLTLEQTNRIEFLREQGNFVLVAEELSEGAAYASAIKATIAFFNL